MKMYRLVPVVLFLGLNWSAICQIPKDTSYVSLAHSFRSTMQYHKSNSSLIFKTFESSKLPLFCKLEHKSDLVSPMQVRFRLGSLDYVNMKISKLIIALFLVSLIIYSCKKDEKVVGCTDPLGDNYNASAEIADSSCTYQKRFLGEYTGQVACGGAFKMAFTKADMSILELLVKNEVNIIIQSTIGPLPLKGTLTKDKLTVDGTLNNLNVNLKDLGLSDTDLIIPVDASINSVLTISADNKTLTGDLNLTMTPKLTGTKIEDKCSFVGTKK
jgi:hypothetical protein